MVRGVTEDVIAVLTAHGTLHGEDQVNVNTAPVAVLGALPGFSREGAIAVAARRTERPFESIADLVAAVPQPWRADVERVLPELAPRLIFALRDIEVRAHARSVRAVADITAVARYMGDGRFEITWWTLQQ